MVLIDFYEYFPDEQTCWDQFLSLRQPNGFICPSCSATKGCFKPSRKLFECYSCKHQTSLTSGTLFHKTRIPLSKWFWFIFFMATSKKGVSMLYLQEQLRISTYRTVWSMGHKIRQGMIVRMHFMIYMAQWKPMKYLQAASKHQQKEENLESNKPSFFMAVQENNHSGPECVTFEEIEGVYESKIFFQRQKNTLRKGSKIVSDG